MEERIKITDDLRKRVIYVHERYHKSYKTMAKESGLDIKILHKIVYGINKSIIADNHKILCRYLDGIKSTLPMRSVGYLKNRIIIKMCKLMSAETGVSFSIAQGIMNNRTTTVSASVWDSLALWVNDGVSTQLKPRNKKNKAENTNAISRSKFASVFSSVLEQRGLTYKELADMIGVSYTAVYNYARMDRLPCRRVLIKIKEVLPEITSLLNLEKE